MAIVQGPALSLSASGNLGAICYATWRGVQVARAASTLVCPMTTPQLKAQTAISTAAVAWSSTLTASQRALWELHATTVKLQNRLGLAWTPSGYQLFMKRSVQSLLLGGSVQATPPIVMYQVLETSVTITASLTPGEAYIEMTFKTGMTQPDKIQIFRAGPYDGGGRRARHPDYLEVQQVGVPYSWTDVGLTTGKFYWYKVRWGLYTGIVGVDWEGQVLIA